MSCKVEGCEGKHKGHGFCEKHLARLRRNGHLELLIAPAGAKTQQCSVDGCEKLISGKGLCETHRQRFKKYGDAGSADLRRNKNGEGSINSKGYAVLYVKGKYKKKHRLIVEKALGKQLAASAIIHHLNGNKADNRPCNLVVCPDEAYHNLLHLRQRQFNYTGPEIPQAIVG